MRFAAASSWPQRTALLLSAIGFAGEPVELDFHGYWRTRLVHLQNAFLDEQGPDDLGAADGTTPDKKRLRGLSRTSFVEQGLRLSPAIRFRQIVSLRLDADVLDQVVFGDNIGLSTAPLFARDPSRTDRFGEVQDAISVRRLWLDLQLPVGVLKVGRQPSQWGMGLLANAGDGLDSEFGDNRQGSTNDRIMFATKPLSIARALLGSASTESNLVVALAWDKLADDAVEDPTTDAELRCTFCAPQILLANPDDDVDQWVGVVMYKNDKWHVASHKGLLHAGVYVVRRTQAETKSDVLVVDGYLHAKLDALELETELLWLTGQTSALAGQKPKEISVQGGAARLTYGSDRLAVRLHGGLAPGDDDPADGSFSGFPFHSDFHVGALMFPEVLAARSARSWGQDVKTLWTRGSVANARYIELSGRYRPIEDLRLIAGVLWARALVDDANVWGETRPPKSASDLDLGWETNLSARYELVPHVHAQLETAIFFAGRGLWRDGAHPTRDLRITDQDQPDPVYSAQLRLAYVF